MKKLLFLLLLVIVETCNGKLFSKDVRFYDSRQLTCNLITSICQDSEGFIWVGTEYGLNKFNGIQFVHYYNELNDSATLLHNTVRQLMLDRSGILWVGCVNGLQYYLSDADCFQHISFENGIIPDISGIAQFKSGEIWISTSGFGIYRIDFEKKKALKVNDIPKLDDYRYYNYVFEDSHGIQWFGVNETGLLQYNPTTHKSKLFTRDDLAGGAVISGMIEDRQGNLLVSTSTTVYLYNRRDDNFQKLSGEDSWIPARQLLNAGDEQVYLATYGKGIQRLNTNRTAFTAEMLSNPYINMQKAKISVIYEDRNRNLWCGCRQKGLLMMSNEASSFDKWTIPTAQYQEAGVVQSVFCDSNGFLWSAIENEGIIKMDKQGNVVEHLLEGRNFSFIEQDKAGDLWFGGKFSGLFQVNTKTGKITQHLESEGYKFEFKCIKEDMNGNLYISIFGRGFIYYNPRTHEVKKFINVLDSNSVSNNWIYKFIIDSQGMLWIGHFNGVDCYNPETGRFTPFSLPGISKYVTYSLLEDGDGKIWAGTNNGLACFDKRNHNVKIFQIKDGLSHNVVYALAKDMHGNIWCSTLKGLSKLQISDGKIVSYYTGRGLIDNEYTSNAAVSYSPDGAIYFGGTNGITVFQPDSITVISNNGHIALSAIYLNGKSVNTKTISGKKPVIKEELCRAKEIELSYNDNTFTLEFTTFTYDDPDNTFYEYRLKGAEKKWNATRPGINQITYNHFPHGFFEIEVRAYRNGVYSDILPISVRVSPPWWQSVWAYIGYTILALLVILQIYFSVKRKHQREMDEEKIKLFVNLSHEIRSPMTLIMNPLDSMLKKEYDEETLRMLRLMKKNSNRIMNLINQLLDMRKIEKGRIPFQCREVDMVTYIKEQISLFDYQANKREIRLCFDSSSDCLPAWIDTNNFDKVLVNIITNALKYTPDGGIIKVLLQERIDEKFIGDLHHYIEIQILDTGVGIDADKLEKIFDRFYTTPSEGAVGGIGFGIGLNLCRLIVKLHHGTIMAHNREDTEGSCFTIRIPYGNMHLKKSELMEETAQVSSAPVQLETEVADDKKTSALKSKQKSGIDKIVVVDDDEEILSYLYNELSSNYKVRTCSNGKEALEIILAENPQLVISDVIMPGLDGYSLLKQIKKNTTVSHIPTILLTSKTELEERIKGIKYGADAYLNKPFNVDELKAVIINLLETSLRLKGKFSGTLMQEDRVDKIEMRLKNDVLMERIMKVINQNIAKPELDVDFLAKEAGLSSAHLHRKLKEMAGVPVATFIRNIRLQQAAFLLKNGEQDVAQVGYAVGFSNQANFSTAFKKQFGVSPSKYAESFQKESRKLDIEE